MDLVSLFVVFYVRSARYTYTSFVLQIFAKQQIELLTAQAWLSQKKQLEDKVCCNVLKRNGLTRCVDYFEYPTIIL